MVSSSSSLARFFPLPIGALATGFLAAGALVVFPLAAAFALDDFFAGVEVLSVPMRAFFVAGPVILAALRFATR